MSNQSCVKLDIGCCHVAYTPPAVYPHAAGCLHCMPCGPQSKSHINTIMTALPVVVVEVLLLYKPADHYQMVGIHTSKTCITKQCILVYQQTDADNPSSTLLAALRIYSTQAQPAIQGNQSTMHLKRLLEPTKANWVHSKTHVFT